MDWAGREAMTYIFFNIVRRNRDTRAGKAKLMRKWYLLLLLLVAGCAEIDLLVNNKFQKKPLDAEMESLVNRAARESGAEITGIRQNDPAVLAWDDVPLEELPDQQRAAKELQRAMYFGVEVTVDGQAWSISYRRYGNEWILDNVSTALINPRTEILFASVDFDPLSNVSRHPVFRHFIPPRHDAAQKAHDAIRRRMRAR